MTMSCHRRVLLTALLLLTTTAAAPADASERPGSFAVVRADVDAVTAPVLLAEGFSFGKWFAGGGRTRVVQFCAGAMCVALFVMIRKLQ